ncbi:hypothetical protein OG204_09425 [Streptomyces sp. NBC_01387]|uniref:hypothetical protein n=1 Tax=unclassified Streptomyces TaxID=2593676 RepID=UPI00224E8B72|nr:hypothetical protein [Streptomyces sp. NBC_01500]MCX4551490.1 hypothetical protein [Streptomyces sp. NBC_01500]
MTATGRSTRGGQLLLFAALLFGIVMMHTVGHPAQDGAPMTGTVMAGAGMPEVRADGARMPEARMPEARMPEVRMPEAHPAAAPAMAPAAAHPPTAPVPHAAPVRAHRQHTEHAPHQPLMDPMSVCLAVLVAWAAALLLRHPAGRPAAVAATPLLRALWPNPPPLAPPLGRLSVLRR